MSQTAGDYLLQRLREWGVEHVFAYPGDGINGMLAAFGRADDQPRFVQARHEEMSAFEAVGYAKFSGKVAVCMATSGPGAIHLLRAMAAIDEAAGYVEQRSAFGAPLSRFEGVSFPLAEHATKLTAARSLCYQALDRRSRGAPHTALAAMAKWFGPRTAVEAVHDCLLLFGHYGYTTDNPMEQRLRDVMAAEIADGTAQIQKIIVARELFGRTFVPYGSN